MAPHLLGNGKEEGQVFTSAAICARFSEKPASGCAEQGAVVRHPGQTNAQDNTTGTLQLAIPKTDNLHQA